MAINYKGGAMDRLKARMIQGQPAKPLKLYEVYVEYMGHYVVDLVVAESVEDAKLKVNSEAFAKDHGWEKADVEHNGVCEIRELAEGEVEDIIE